MATTLYLHSDLSAVGGTLPTTEQAVDLTPDTLWVSNPESSPTPIDMSATHRNMDESQGSSENDLWFQAQGEITNVVTYDHQYLAMVGQFISPELSAGAIGAGNWTLYLDATGGDDSGFLARVSLGIYLWRPSTGAKISTIWEADDPSGFDFYVVNDLGARSEYDRVVSAAGATAQAGDVILVEVWVETQSIGLGDSELYLFYDTGTDGRIVAPDLPFEGGGPPPGPGVTTPDFSRFPRHRLRRNG